MSNITPAKQTNKILNNPELHRVGIVGVPPLAIILAHLPCPG